jgi:hypothetical protein
MMEITESSNPKSKLLCSVRGEWVEALPEERVRQALIRLMTEQLGYPRELLVIERALHQFPHLALQSTRSLPRRRADLVCYGKGIHPDFPLYPLLLVECKAVPLTSKAIQQLTGYNHYLRAPFVALCNANEVKSGYFDPIRKGYVFVDKLPSYRELLAFKGLGV